MTFPPNDILQVTCNDNPGLGERIIGSCFVSLLEYQKEVGWLFMTCELGCGSVVLFPEWFCQRRSICRIIVMYGVPCGDIWTLGSAFASSWLIELWKCRKPHLSKDAARISRIQPATLN